MTDEIRPLGYDFWELSMILIISVADDILDSRYSYVKRKFNYRHCGGKTLESLAMILETCAKMLALKASNKFYNFVDISSLYFVDRINLFQLLRYMYFDWRNGK